MLIRPGHNAFVAASSRPYICQSCLWRRRCQPSAPRAHATRVLSQALSTDSVWQASKEAPFRKALKDAAKQKKKEKASGKLSSPESGQRTNAQAGNWELTVGIEIHAELNTARKLFSPAAAAASPNAPPNSHVALFDVTFPGSQPQFQRDTLIPALRAALALNCEIQDKSCFDRKHYFYQDQPAGYQITQYYEPFARNGHITLFPHDYPNGVSPQQSPLHIGIKQIQMEQDTAKTIQQPPSTHLLDFNRVSHPLIEIITLPQIHHPTTAAVLVRKIQAILKAVNAVTAGMEMGGLRADVNVSVRQRNTRSSGVHSYSSVTGLGQRTEIKNLASIKAVEDAIIAERDRQIELIESGGTVEGETRGWALGSRTTKRLRSKEGEVDYRYMPDPDIPPVILGKDLIEYLKNTLPTVPDDTIEDLISERYGLTTKDAITLLALDNGDRLDYYLDVVQILQTAFANDQETLPRVGKVAGNWVLMELAALFKDDEWSSFRLPSAHLASIITHVLRKQITGRTAKLLLAWKFQGDPRSIEQIIQEGNMLLRPLSREEYITLAQQLIDEKPDIVKTIVEKQQIKKLKWFVGQMMARGKEGTVEAGTAEAVLRQLLQLPSPEKN